MRADRRAPIGRAPIPIAAAIVLALLAAAIPIRAHAALTIFPAAASAGLHGG